MKLWTLATAGALLAMPALAQTATPAHPGMASPAPSTMSAPAQTSTSTTMSPAPANAAVATSSVMATKPASGANSFSILEAIRRIQAHGYTNLTGIHKDTHGVWRAMASTANMPGVGTTKTSGPLPLVSVWLDYKGNVGVQ